jgi:hypothetical protein
MSAGESIRHVPANVLGVSLANEDGTSRQEIIARCSRFERLVLEREKGGRRDPDAIRVCRENGEQIGRLPPEISSEIVARRAASCRCEAYIRDFPGGERSSKTRGVSLWIVVAQPGVSERQFNRYVRKLTGARSFVTEKYNLLLFIAAIILTVIIILVFEAW